jgi:hypothetical protein
MVALKASLAKARTNIVQFLFELQSDDDESTINAN